MLSKPRPRPYLGKSMRVTCLLLMRQPVFRRHDLDLGSFMERGNLWCDVKRKSTSAETRGRNINAYRRGGSSRSSDEGFVMELEQRGCADSRRNSSRWKHRGTPFLCVARKPRGGRSRCWQEPYEARVSRTESEGG